MKDFIHLKKIREKLAYLSKVNANGCRLYLGPKDKDGYGRINYKGNTVRVHRLIMHLNQDFDLNSKDLILHKNNCPNKNCFEEIHLYIGNEADNAVDTIKKGNFYHNNTNKTHCKFGHELEKVGNRRRCRTCDRRVKKEYKEKMKIQRRTNHAR